MRITPLLVFVCVGIGIGCFNPHYQDGGFLCGAGNACPGGYDCIDGRCWAANGPGPSGQRDAGAMEMPPDEPDTGVAIDGPPLPRRRLMETCDPRNAGMPGRTDNCADGLVCVDGNITSLCFKRCVTSDECGQMACEDRQVEAGGPMVQVCGMPPTSCSPANNSGCNDQRICYLSGANTVCEISSGENVRMACTYSRECFPGYTCATGIGAGYCRRVCDETSACPEGTMCRIAVGSLGHCF